MPAPATAVTTTHEPVSVPQYSEAVADGGDELVSMDDCHYGSQALPWRKETLLPRQPRPVPRPSNQTGLPDNLKYGIESLSGFNLDRVKVHYNSHRPAQLQALAYAQGSEIHLAPGQERHLPHEAWHVVQQASGRVKSRVQLKNGDGVNHDHGLEHEADVMGRAAMRYDAASHSGVAGDRTWAASSVVQRMPVAALNTIDVKMDEEELREKIVALRQILRNAQSIVSTFPLISVRTETYLSIKATLMGSIVSLTNSLRRSARDPFLEKWNEGLAPRALARYTPGSRAMKYTPVDAKAGFAGNAADSNFLNQWSKKKIADKKMNADKKMAGMMPLILPAPALPEDLLIALKLFFGHTANFVPEENLGRDFLSTQHGNYYRSSLDVIRKKSSASLKRTATELFEDVQAVLPTGQTFQVINRPFHQAVLDAGKLGSNIGGMKFIGDASNRLNYAFYPSSGGSHTGALGLIQNVYRTLQVSGGQDSVKGEDSPPIPVGEEFSPVVPEHQLLPASDQNYHDLLLSDRGALIAEVAAEISRKYHNDKDGDGVRIVPIQSASHASLILALVYPADISAERQLSEKTWRELFITTFNEAARSKKLQTRLTHRGSFGFLYPTASSVGGPVRIWPGLAPPAIFKELVFSTLDKLAIDQELFPGVHFQAPAESAPSSSPKGKATLHMEALKAAVRYAQDVMRETSAANGPAQLVAWLAARLQRNLVKAGVLLGLEETSDSLEPEDSYLKSALATENLMEYSYLLEAMRAGETSEHDPYPAYLRRKLAIPADQASTEYRETETFYLDSGMQAIVNAHLLARKWQEQMKRVTEGGELNTIDLYSYFEYAMVDKLNLKLNARNRTKEGHIDLAGFNHMLATTFKDISPAIIAADLNPVLTSVTAKDTQIPYAAVFARFSASPSSGSKSPTIPIVDVTNASLDKVAELNLGAGYENFIVVESLSKHQQLGADKFTMGRLSAVGSKEFVALAKLMLRPIEEAAYHRLPAMYRLRMDRVFYGDSTQTRDSFAISQLKAAPDYDRFMELAGPDLSRQWQALNKDASATADEVQERFLAMNTLLNQGLAQYKKALLSDASGRRDLDEAYKSLPRAAQRRLQNELEQELDKDEFENALVQRSFLMTGVPTSGIENAGNTCYLAAALNMLAFTPHRSLFQPRDDDPDAVLRAMVLTLLNAIRAGQLITRPAVTRLLSALDHAELLEGPNGFGAQRPLHAQRDPAEVMEYLLNYFGIAAEERFQLQHTASNRINPGTAVPVQNGNAAGYTEVNAEGNFPALTSSDWMIKLPISDGDNLFQLLDRYQAESNVEQFTAVYNHQVFRGPGVARTVLGTQTPDTISIQLVRWEFTRGQVRKNQRAIDMPAVFFLNNVEYHLEAVIHHQGTRAQGGHYTASTLDRQRGWLYRDDASVAPDPQFSEKKDLGYIYTYVRTGLPADEIEQMPEPVEAQDGEQPLDQADEWDFGLQNLDMPYLGLDLQGGYPDGEFSTLTDDDFYASLPPFALGDASSHPYDHEENLDMPSLEHDVQNGAPGDDSGLAITHDWAPGLWDPGSPAFSWPPLAPDAEGFWFGGEFIDTSPATQFMTPDQ
jgi:Ubiquitin carboxyl-terminal hydrolase/Domain of unknown function (DUF4157)